MGCVVKVSALWGWFEALGDTSSIDEVMVFVLAGAGWTGGISRIWVVRKCGFLCLERGENVVFRVRSVATKRVFVCRPWLKSVFSCA